MMNDRKGKARITKYIRG